MPQIGLVKYVDEVALQIQNGQLDEAVAHCRHILSHYSMYIPVYRLLGYANLEQGDYAHATHFFQSVLSADPEDADAWSNLAMLSDDLGELEQAIWLMERAFEIEPGDAETRDRLRHFYSHRDGVERVRIKLTPTALGRLYAASGFYRRAAQEFDKVLRSAALHPLHVAYIETNLARTLIQIPGMAPVADKVCRSLLEKLPRSLVGNLIMGQIRSSAGLDKEAAPYLQIARALDPEGRVAYKTFGNQSPIPLTQIEIPYLKYEAKQSTVERALEAPPVVDDTSWLDHVGETFGIGAELTQTPEGTTEAPAWLQEWSTEDLEAAPPRKTDSVPDWVTTIQDAESEPVVPDWLRNLQQESTATPAAGSTPPVETPTQPTQDEALPDWLKTLGTEPEAGDAESEPSIAEAFSDAQTPTWLQGMGDEPAVHDETQDQAVSLDGTDLPDWLQELSSTDEAAAPQSSAHKLEDQDVPDWLREFTPEEQTLVSEPMTEDLEKEEPDWLQDLRVEAKAPASEAVEPEEKEPTAALEEEEELPDWLRDLRPEAKAPSFEAAEPAEEPIAALEEEELPDWLQDLRPEAEAPSFEAAVPEEEESIAALEEEELPDWLQDLRPEAKAPSFEAAVPEEEESIAALEEEELPDWLQDLRPEAEASAPEAAEEPLAALDEEELPDWLQGLRVEAKAPASEAVEPEEEEPIAALEEEEVPDWLRDLRPEAEAPSFEAAVPEEEEPLAALEEEELPDWLQDLRPEAETPLFSAAVPEEEEPIAALEEEKVPDWLQDLDERTAETSEQEIAETPDEQELADWLQELRAEGKAAQPRQPAEQQEPEPLPSWLQDLRSEPETMTPEPAADLLQDKEIPDWLQELHPESAILPSDEITLIPEAELAEEPVSPIPVEPVDETELPDWLRELRPQSGVPVTSVLSLGPEAIQEGPASLEPVTSTAGAARAEMPPPVEGMPGWLVELEAEISGQAQPRESTPVSEPISAAEPQVEMPAARIELPPAVEGMPRWLTDLEAEIAGIPLSPSIEALAPVQEETVPIEMPAPVEDMPQWLTLLEADISGQAPAQEIQDVDVEREPETAFQSYRPEPAVEEREPEPVAQELEPELAELEPDWLRELEEMLIDDTTVPQAMPEIPVQAQESIVEPPIQDIVPSQIADQVDLSTVFSQEQVKEEEKPEWLEELQTEPADQVTVEEIPDWLEPLRSQDEGRTSEQPSGAEEEMEWLQTLMEMPEPPAVPEGDFAPPETPAPVQEPERKPGPARAPAAIPAQQIAQARVFLQEGALDAAVQAYTPLIETAELRDQVIHDLEQAVQDHPRHPDLYQILGDAYMRAGQLQKALQSYQRALANL